MNPYDVLGVAQSASRQEVRAAYRVLVQIFHPDRLQDCPIEVQREAERRLQQVNEAYALLAGGTRAHTAAAQAATRRDTRERVRTAPPRVPLVPWDAMVRARVDQALRAEQVRLARDQSVPNGEAVARSQPPKRWPLTLNGLGEALVTNKLRCRRCRAVQWLPDGWRAALASDAYFCSQCDCLLLSR